MPPKLVPGKRLAKHPRREAVLAYGLKVAEKFPELDGMEIEVEEGGRFYSWHESEVAARRVPPRITVSHRGLDEQEGDIEKWGTNWARCYGDLLQCPLHAIEGPSPQTAITEVLYQARCGTEYPSRPVLLRTPWATRGYKWHGFAAQAQEAAREVLPMVSTADDLGAEWERRFRDKVRAVTGRTRLSALEDAFDSAPTKTPWTLVKGGFLFILVAFGFLLGTGIGGDYGLYGSWRAPPGHAWHYTGILASVTAWMVAAGFLAFLVLWAGAVLTGLMHIDDERQDDPHQRASWASRARAVFGA